MGNAHPGEKLIRQYLSKQSMAVLADDDHFAENGDDSEFALRSSTEDLFGRGRNTVRAMSRRNFLADILPGSAIAVAGFTAIGWTVTSGSAEATQTAAQAAMVRPHRHMRSRHRRWGCWWQRGRRWWHWGHRVCGWR